MLAAMLKPVVILELCCCEGVGASGYIRSGAVIYGVDLEARFARRYPGAGFHHGDGLVVLRTLLAGGVVTFTRPDGSTVDLCLEDFDFIHASPPCQGYTRGNAGKETSWPKLIPDFRALLQRTGLPYVIENVKDAGPEMVAPVTLCGCMFSLQALDVDGQLLHLLRPRLFEANWDLQAPQPCDHEGMDWVAGAYGGTRKAYRLPWESNVEVAPRDRHSARFVRKGGYVPREKRVVQALLGVDSRMRLTWNGLYESIPPAYTHWVGGLAFGGADARFAATDLQTPELALVR